MRWVQKVPSGDGWWIQYSVPADPVDTFLRRVDGQPPRRPGWYGHFTTPDSLREGQLVRIETYIARFTGEARLTGNPTAGASRHQYFFHGVSDLRSPDDGQTSE